MKKYLLILLSSTLSIAGYSQVANPMPSTFYYSAKEFSKDIALFRAKDYVVNNVFTKSDDAVQFEMDPLAAASSGELTSLVYKSKKLNKEGLILGFYGSKWTESGNVYQAYAFKDLPSAKAVELLNKIEKVLKENSKYLNSDATSNNVYFSFDDLTCIISFEGQTNIRVFWNNFDATWDIVAFKRTKKRLLKKLD